MKNESKPFDKIDTAITSWMTKYSVTYLRVSLSLIFIGLGLLLKICMRATLLFLFLQMLATSIPIILLPDVVFNQAPFALTLEGHHIIKNLVIIGAGLVLGATVRGGHLVETKT